MESCTNLYSVLVTVAGWAIRLHPNGLSGQATCNNNKNNS